MTNHQRKHSKSNAHVGASFEALARQMLSEELPHLEQSFGLRIGFDSKKVHRFDFGSSKPKVIVECKTHTWTESWKVPTAKLTTWDQAMLYFSLVPRAYRKLFVVKRHFNPRRKQTLLDYYFETHAHVIPHGVEFWELDEGKKTCVQRQFPLADQ